MLLVYAKDESGLMKMEGPNTFTHKPVNETCKEYNNNNILSKP